MPSEETVNKEELAQEAYDLAYEYERSYQNCAQAVFCAIQDVLEIGDDATFQAAHPFAAGCALTSQGTCGAVNGALLAIGSVYGRDKAHFAGGSRNKDSYRLSKRLVDRFNEEFGGILCCDVQTKLMGRSFNLWTDNKEFERAGAHVDKCPSVTGKVARWAVEMLLEQREKAAQTAAGEKQTTP